jgi:hypothetical protein
MRSKWNLNRIKQEKSVHLPCGRSVTPSAIDQLQGDASKDMVQVSLVMSISSSFCTTVASKNMCEG